MDIPPEIIELSEKLKRKYGVIRAISQSFVMRALNEAEEYKGTYIAYWETAKARYLFIYRLDRQPLDDEVLAWLQTLFEDGQIHEEQGPNFRSFFQGDVYSETTADIILANAIAEASEQDRNADAFDFARTDSGKRLARRLRNGTN